MTIEEIKLRCVDEQKSLVAINYRFGIAIGEPFVIGFSDERDRVYYQLFDKFGDPIGALKKHLPSGYSHFY